MKNEVSHHAHVISREAVGEQTHESNRTSRLGLPRSACITSPTSSCLPRLGRMCLSLHFHFHAYASVTQRLRLLF